MSELDLSRCPICQTSRRLVRQVREVQGQSFVWYECPECASALLWLGGDRWVYQKVGRGDRQYLVKRPLTTVELQSLSAATIVPSVAPTYSFTQEPLPDVSSEPEDIDLEPEFAPPPDATPTKAAERPKGISLSVVMAVAVIALLCIVAAIVIIAMQS
jgi:hypothetical protein